MMLRLQGFNIVLALLSVSCDELPSVSPSQGHDLLPWACYQRSALFRSTNQQLSPICCSYSPRCASKILFSGLHMAQEGTGRHPDKRTLRDRGAEGGNGRGDREWEQEPNESQQSPVPPTRRSSPKVRLQGKRLPLRAVGPPDLIKQELLGWRSGKSNPGSEPSGETRIGRSSGDYRSSTENKFDPSVVPKNLSFYRDLTEMLEVFNEYVVDEEIVISPSDAVAAMNHLKRLQRQAWRDKALSQRLDATVMRFTKSASLGVYRMSPKSLALALNSLALRKGYEWFFELSIQRIRDMCAENREFQSQSLAMMVNALVKQRMYDRDLFSALAAMAQRLPPEQYKPQAVAIILNGFSKTGHEDLSLFHYLGDVAKELSVHASWDAQAAALLLNAFARARIRDKELFNRFAEVAVAIPRDKFSPQNVANIVNAFAKNGIKHHALFARMSEVSRSFPLDKCDPQAVANILNAFAKLEVHDVALFRRLGEATKRTPPSAFSAQGLANTLNAQSKITPPDRELLAFVSDVVVSCASASSASPSGKGHMRFDSQAIANVVNAFARVEVADGRLFAHCATLAMDIPPHAWDPQGVALVLNAYAKLGVVDQDLFQYLGAVATDLPPANFNAQAVSNIANAFAKVELTSGPLFARLSEIARGLDMDDFSSQAVSTTLNAFAKLEIEDTDLFLHLGNVAKRLPPRSFLPQALANTLNACVKAEVYDRELFEHLAWVAQQIPAEQYSGQSIGVMLNAFIRSPDVDHDLFRYLSTVVQSLPIEIFEAQNVALVVNAFAKAGIVNDALFNRMAAAALHLEFSSADAQNLAVIMNAFAKSELRETDPLVPQLFDKLARSVHILELGSASTQAIGNIINSYARHMHVRAGGGVLQITQEDELLFAHLSSLAKQLEAPAFDALTVTLFVNSFSRAGIKDEALFRHLSKVAQQFPVDEFDGQAIANIAYSFAKGNFSDPPLFAHLANAAMAIEPESFSVFSVVLIISTTARPELSDRALVHRMTEIACQMPREAWKGQACSNLLNGLVRHYELGTVGEDTTDMAFGYISEVILSTEIYMWEGVYDAHNIAIIVNAFARVDKLDARVFEHLSYMAQQMHPDQFDVQSVANIVNAFVKVGVDREVLQYLMEFMSMVTQCFDTADDMFAPQAISNIVNAFSRVDMVDVVLFDHLALAALLIPPEEFNPQSVANIVNAYSKLLNTGEEQSMDVTELFLHMSSAAKLQPQEALEMQNIANMMNAWARMRLRDEELFSHLGTAVARIAVDGFVPDAQAASNILHALATFNIRNQHILDALSRTLPAVHYSACVPQGIANACWSMSVLQLRDLALLAWVRGALRGSLPDMNWSCLRQVQQFLLTCQLDRVLPEIERFGIAQALAEIEGPQPPAAPDEDEWTEVTRACARGLVARAEESMEGSAQGVAAISRMLKWEASPSRLQDDVVQHVRLLGKDCVEEFADVGAGYSIDAFLPETNTAVEVDGPFHFSRGERVQLGNSVMKHRHLRQLGYSLVSVPYWEWSDLLTTEERVRYLSSLVGGSVDDLPAPTALLELRQQTESEGVAVERVEDRKSSSQTWAGKPVSSEPSVGELVSEPAGQELDWPEMDWGLMELDATAEGNSEVLEPPSGNEGEVDGEAKLARKPQFRGRGVGQGRYGGGGRASMSRGGRDDRGASTRGRGRGRGRGGRGHRRGLWEQERESWPVVEALDVNYLAGSSDLSVRGTGKKWAPPLREKSPPPRRWRDAIAEALSDDDDEEREDVGRATRDADSNFFSGEAVELSLDYVKDRSDGSPQ